jgi:hypothetical protein
LQDGVDFDWYESDHDQGGIVIQDTLLPLLKTNTSTSPDSCKYLTFIIVAYSLGGDSALHIIPRNYLQYDRLKLDALFVLDPVPTSSSRTYSTHQSVARTVNWYQQLNTDDFGIPFVRGTKLQGRPVAGAENHNMTESDFAPTKSPFQN